MKVLLLLIIISVISCKNSVNEKVNNNVIATINNNEIYFRDIDKRVEQDLYNLLYHVYLVRKLSTDQLIAERIIQIEAKKANESVDSYLYRKIYSTITNKKLIEFSRNNNLSNNNLLKLENVYKEYILKNYIDSLKKLYSIKYFINPPEPPSLDFSDIKGHFNGNLNSTIQFWEISDLDCSNCKEAQHIYSKFYEKYKNIIKFFYVHYSSDVSISMIASECAAKQNKFWEMKKLIYEYNMNLDSTICLKFARKLGLNIEKFKKDFNDPKIYEMLFNNFRLLSNKGINGTPTIVINGKKIRDPFSEKEIEETIKNEILKNK